MDKLSKHFFDLVEKQTGQNGQTKFNGNKVFLPNNEKFLHAPNFNVSNTNNLDTELEKYLKTINSVKTGFTNPLNIKGNFNDFFLYNLLRDMTNSDYENLPDYVRRRTDYINDTTFQDLDKETELTKLDNYVLSAQRKQELHGLETPFSMNFYFRNHSKPYRLPKVRYGISNEQKGKTACIYCVQDGQLGTQKVGFVEQLEKRLNGVNTGMNKYRNCEPRQVISLALFLRIAHKYGIRNITAPDYIPLRYGIRYGECGKKINNDDELDKIQSRTTDSFMRLFQRISSQINGVDITAFPNDIDSYLHIELGEQLSTKNELLSQLCNIPREQIIEK